MRKPPKRKPDAPDPRRPASAGRAARSTERWIPWLAYGAIALYGLYWAVKAFTQHHLGNYTVETDFYWKYGPAAAALKQGKILIENFDSKGWGYPLVVAGVSFLGLDLFRAAQLVALVSACAAALCLFRFHRKLIGSTPALLSVLLLMGNAAFLANTYEVGTDMFFFAVTLGAIALLLASEMPGWPALIGSGLLGGWAFSTRYNGLFLWPAALISILVIGRGGTRSARWRAAGLWSASFLVAAAPWLIVNWAHTGNPLTNNNYTNVGFSVYGEGNWEKFFYGGDRKIHSFADVVLLDPGRFAQAMVQNVGEHLRRDLTELLPILWGVLATAGFLLVALERRGRLWAAYLVFGALYFVTLVPVFYGTRFSIPMLSFYTALAIAPFTWRPLETWALGVERRFPLRILVFLLLWFPGAIAAYGWTENPQNAEGLRAGPYETLEAVDFLKSHGAGEALLARKPHVAFVAGMRFVPIPQVDSPEALHEIAVRAGARFLLVSGAEMALRAALRPFAEPNASVPGFIRVFESKGALIYEVTVGGEGGRGAGPAGSRPASAGASSGALKP